MKLEVIINNEDKNLSRTIKGDSIKDFKDIIIKEGKAGENYRVKINGEITRVLFNPDGSLWFYDYYGKTSLKEVLIETDQELKIYLNYSRIEDLLNLMVEKGLIDGCSIEILNNNDISYTGYISLDEGGLKNIEGVFTLDELSEKSKKDILKEIRDTNNI